MRAGITGVRSEPGFTLIEILVAMLVTVIVMSAVFGLLTRAQGSFAREPEVSVLQENARTGLETITRDLVMAGYKTPGAAAVLWHDGGGNDPDQITILYADPDVPTAELKGCGYPCGNIDRMSALTLELDSMDPVPADPVPAYPVGMTLFALEYEDCNIDDMVGLYAFEVAEPPTWSATGDALVVSIDHNSSSTMSELSLPVGFNSKVKPDCAVVGFLRVVQYRISPAPPTPNPTLERRDIALGETWTAVSGNIENLQFQYATTDDPVPVAFPLSPHGDVPSTWITRVKVTLTGRSESTNLPGGSGGVFATADTYLRKTFSTSVSLRNVTYQVAAVIPSRSHLGW